MVIGEHAVIRNAEHDDARIFKSLYRLARPIAALLNSQREFVPPTLEELRGILGGAGGPLGPVNAIEDKDGRIRGFFSLREHPGELPIGQFAVMMLEESGYTEPAADEVMTFVLSEAYNRHGMIKVISYAVDYENALRDFLLRNGYQSDGVQREILFTGGQWRGLESFTHYNPGANAPRARHEPVAPPVRGY